MIVITAGIDIPPNASPSSRYKIQKGMQRKEQDCYRLKILFPSLAGSDVEEQ